MNDAAESSARKRRTQAAERIRHTFPSSFATNDVKEKFVLWRAANFRSQVVSFLPHVPPLVLCLENELGVSKFVSTTISPNFLPYEDLYSWDGCSSFVADLIKYVPPESSDEQPRTLYSPACVLQTRFATSIEASTLLCSLLAGVGYDAYVVSGFAHRRRVADRDLSFRAYSPRNIQASWEPGEEEEAEPESTSTCSRYPSKLRPKKEFSSRYEQAMAERSLADESVLDALSQPSKQQPAVVHAASTSPADEAHEKAAHFWVLILPGKRDARSAFFIEPSTGEKIDLHCPHYYEVVSVWNHENYWVNLNPEQKEFDLNNPEKWEPFSVDPLTRTRLYKAAANVRPTAVQGGSAMAAASTSTASDVSQKEHSAPGTSVPAAATTERQENASPAEAALQQAMDAEEVPEWLPAFQMPSSWVGQLTISPETLESRFPDNKKTDSFSNAEVEQFSPHYMQNGLIRRVKYFNQKENHADQCDSSEKKRGTPPLERVVEQFANRSDCLVERIEDFEKPKLGWITEKFEKGREDGVREHHYTANLQGGFVQRLVFWPEARADFLQSRETMAGVRLHEKYLDVASCSRRPHSSEGEAGEEIRVKNPFESRNSWSLASVYSQSMKEKAVTLEVSRGFSKGASKSAHDSSSVRVKEILEVFGTSDIREDRALNSTETEDSIQNVSSILYSFEKREIKVSYLPGRGRITFSTLTYKVPELNEKGQVEVFTMDMAKIEKADAKIKSPTRLELYRILEQLVKLQNRSKELVQKSLKENEAFIANRETELTNLTLRVPIFHPFRNTDLRRRRLEEEKEEADRKARASDDTVDPLLPYLCRRKPTDISWDDFCQSSSSRPISDLADTSDICEEYLSDIRTRIVDKANYMQAKVEQTSEKLKQLQRDYQSKVGQLSAQMERQMVEEMKMLQFSLTVLEKRLKILRKDSHEKYVKEERTVRTDARVQQSLMLP